MSPRIAVLDRDRHRALRIDPRPSASRGDARNFVRVVLAEFDALAGQCPIYVSKDSETGAFFCGAVMGFVEGENLLLTTPGLSEPYRPLELRRQPFVSVEGRLGIELDHPRTGVQDGEPLFGADGAPTRTLLDGRDALAALRGGLEETDAFLRTLTELRLLKPMAVELSFDDGARIELEGLYAIDLQALQALDDAEVVRLFRAGWLKAVDLMVLSANQLSRLAERRNASLI